MMLFLYEIRKLDKVCLSMLLLLLPDGSRGRGRIRSRSRSLLLGNVSSWNWEILKQPVWVEFRTKIKRWRQSCCGYLAKSCNSNLKLWFGSILLAKRNFLFSSLLLLFYWLPELNWTQLWIVIEARAISSGWILQSSKLKAHLLRLSLKLKVVLSGKWNWEPAYRFSKLFLQPKQSNFKLFHESWGTY